MLPWAARQMTTSSGHGRQPSGAASASRPSQLATKGSPVAVASQYARPAALASASVMPLARGW